MQMYTSFVKFLADKTNEIIMMFDFEILTDTSACVHTFFS